MHFQAEGCSQVPGLTLQQPVATLLPMPFPSPAWDGLHALAPETSHTHKHLKRVDLVLILKNLPLPSIHLFEGELSLLS